MGTTTTAGQRRVTGWVPQNSRLQLLVYLRYLLPTKQRGEEQDYKLSSNHGKQRRGSTHLAFDFSASDNAHHDTT